MNRYQDIKQGTPLSFLPSATSIKPIFFSRQVQVVNLSLVFNMCIAALVVVAMMVFVDDTDNDDLASFVMSIGIQPQ